MSTPIPVGAFEYRANNAQAVSATDQLVRSVEKLNAVKLDKLDLSFSNLTATLGRFTPALAVLAVGRFALGAVQAADALGDAADRADISVESFSKLKYVAEQSDIEFGELTASIRKYQVGLGAAARGGGPMLETLARLNLSARELSKLSVEDQLARIADRFRDAVPSVDRAKVATDLFGKSGTALIPLLNRGAAGVKELSERADELGITLNSRSTKAIDNATKSLGSFFGVIKAGIANATGYTLAAVFGTGDELSDLETRYASLTEQLRQYKYQAEKFPLSSPDAAQRIANITAAIDEMKPRLSVLRDLQRIQRGENISGGPNSRRIDPVTEFNVTLKKIGEGDDAYEKILTAIEKRRAEAHTAMQETLLSGWEAVRAASEDAAGDNAKTIGARVSKELEERISSASAWREHERSEEEKLQAELLNIRQQGALAAQSLLTAYGGKFAGIARAILIVEKTMAIKSIVMDTQAAMMKVIKQWGAPWGYAAAAAVAVYGAARVAAVASTVAGGDSAPAIGSPHNPVSVTPGSSDDPTTGGSTDQGGQRIVQLIIHGNVYSGRESTAFIIEQIQDAINEYDTVIINPNSRQARDLRGDETT